MILYVTMILFGGVVWEKVSCMGISHINRIYINMGIRHVRRALSRVEVKVPNSAFRVLICIYGILIIYTSPPRKVLTICIFGRPISTYIDGLYDNEHIFIYTVYTARNKLSPFSDACYSAA